MQWYQKGNGIIVGYGPIFCEFFRKQLCYNYNSIAGAKGFKITWW